MDLWIRSQDKAKLLKLHGLYVDLPLDFGKNGYGVYAPSEQTKTGFEILGVYKSKERALEVLDEIQSLIETKNDCYYSIKEDAYIQSNGVYEMPKE